MASNIKLPTLPGMTGTREWVYPQSIQGRFMTLRRWTFLGLHLVLFASPWITMRGHPLLLIDVPARRVFLLGQIFTPSDTIFLALLLFFLAFSLFFFTAIFGRVWCGYACPQTVFLESWIRPGPRSGSKEIGRGVSAGTLKACPSTSPGGSWRSGVCSRW